jgi:prevent-host-death family protein
VDKLAEAVTSTLGPEWRSVILEKLPGGHQRRRASSGTPVVTGSIRVMKTAPAEMTVRELRADLAELINVAWTRDQVTFVTSCGRRVAAVVTVAVAEQAAGDSGPAAGARFKGTNQMGSKKWRSDCVVTACVPGKRFAFDVKAGPFQVVR